MLATNLPPLTNEEHDLAWGDTKGPTFLPVDSDGKNRVARTEGAWTLVSSRPNQDVPDEMEILWARRKDGAPLIPVEVDIATLRAQTLKQGRELGDALGSMSIMKLQGQTLLAERDEARKLVEAVKLELTKVTNSRDAWIAEAETTASDRDCLKLQRNLARTELDTARNDLEQMRAEADTQSAARYEAEVACLDRERQRDALQGRLETCLKGCQRLREERDVARTILAGKRENDG